MKNASWTWWCVQSGCTCQNVGGGWGFKKFVIWSPSHGWWVFFAHNDGWSWWVPSQMMMMMMRVVVVVVDDDGFLQLAGWKWCWIKLEWVWWFAIFSFAGNYDVLLQNLKSWRDWFPSGWTWMNTSWVAASHMIMIWHKYLQWHHHPIHGWVTQVLVTSSSMSWMSDTSASCDNIIIDELDEQHKCLWQPSSSSMSWMSDTRDDIIIHKCWNVFLTWIATLKDCIVWTDNNSPTSIYLQVPKILSGWKLVFVLAASFSGTIPPF